MQDDESFIDFLGFADLIAAYKKEKDEAIAEIVRKFTNEREQLIRSKLEGIRLDQSHRRILNACIFPFSEGGTLPGLGYSFVRASPLFEKGETNLDFLIFNPAKKIAISGEAKGSVSDSGIVVDQTKKRIKTVEQNHGYINQKYLNTSGADIETVLGVSWTDSTEVMKSALRKGGGLIVWQAGIDLKEQGTKLSIVVPPGQADGAHKSMRHMDDDLNKSLVSVKTSHDFKTFFPESHSFAKLLILTMVDKGKTDGLFDLQDLQALMREELDYLEEEAIIKETNKILQLGEAIGFVGRDKAKYYIHSHSKRANVRESELKELWINYQLERDKEKEIEPILVPIQAKYVELRKSYKQLDEF